ncbi:MAG: glycosyltransferase [Bdellovibrionales bacterium]|nr:glycosyltransferase [Bdellovibrionales bacterium]
MKASVILATYEWPEALDMVFAGLATQSEKNFEVCLADDGSGVATRRVVEKWRGALPIRHFRQDHKGFRKSRILNAAIRASRGATLIFLDGDCVPHREFVEQHLRLQEKGRYVAGRRVDLSRDVTRALSPALVGRGYLNGHPMGLLRLFLDSFREGGSTPFHRAYLVRNPLLRHLTGLDRVVDLKGCNFSVSREDMLAINGFDERYEGYGREDTDVELRLQNLGLGIKSAKNLCLQFHLWHEPRAFTPANETLLAEVASRKTVRAAVGIHEGDAIQEVTAWAG